MRRSGPQAAKLSTLGTINFGHRIFEEDEPFYLFPPPEGTPRDQLWRYQSNGVFWERQDDVFWDIRRALDNQVLRFDPPSIVPEVVYQEVRRVCDVLNRAGRQRLCRLFTLAYPYTLEKTTFPLHDGTTYVITGDIKLMWHRDSCAQVNQYLSIAKESAALQALIDGLIRRQVLFIRLDPYATSFRMFLDFDNAGKNALTDWDYQSGRTIHVAMHNYELDNLCYFMRLSHSYWQATGRSGVFDDIWLEAVDLIFEVVEREQNHDNSKYRYPELPAGGHGAHVCGNINLTWTGFRPSDDQTQLGYLIPSNMFAVVTLRNIAKMMRAITHDEVRAVRAERLADEIDYGIHQHAVRDGMYAYEVDGCGGVNLMDDANIPSLLSLEYLGYKSKYDPTGAIAQKTRQWVLSSQNKFFFSSGKYAGVGSPHTPSGYVWHLALAVQGITSKEDDELRSVLWQIETSATNDVMHEGFSVSNPTAFTRPSFAWANSLFSEFVQTRLNDIARLGS